MSDVTESQFDRRSLVRGSTKRVTDFMEQLQNGYVRAVAAAAGVVLSKPEVDEGIDFIATHRANIHFAGIAIIELQLKATTMHAGGEPDTFAAEMSRDRYDYFRDPDPSITKLVVVMNQPREQCDWINASHEALRIQHAAYWVNLRGWEERSADRVTVRAPRTQVFDDVALCTIMAKVGQGEAP